MSFGLGSEGLPEAKLGVQPLTIYINLVKVKAMMQLGALVSTIRRELRRHSYRRYLVYLRPYISRKAGREYLKFRKEYQR